MDVKHIAKLARLKIEDDKIADFERDMEKIVAMIDGLPDNERDILTENVNPMSLREDRAVTDKFTRDELLANSPKVQSGCFAVPKTVE
ncbi:MAG: Asp-tRNA(Asn)/Glu-tRNA(Gln) amidotransferase subunit GatC [Ruminococcus sp.]|nr:Asp-tRNA(Asn)/Glu-tRNA(Gln) amidotransferase subunit GatC [Ruminococcus sp.]